MPNSKQFPTRVRPETSTASLRIVARDATALAAARGPLDADCLARLQRIGGPVLVSQLVELFVEAAPRRVAAIRGAEDAGEVEREAHALRASAGNLGAARLCEMCARIEDGARSGRILENHDALGRKLYQEQVRVSAALQRHLTDRIATA